MTERAAGGEHKDLLSDEDEIVGHIGFTIDTKELKKLGKKAGG